MRDTNVQVPVGNPFGDLSIRDFLIPLFRRKQLLLITFLAVLSIVILVGLVGGPVYSAHMAILVNRERLDQLVSTEPSSQIVATDNPVTPEEINSEVELLSSRDVLERVVVANGLEKPAGFSISDLLAPNQSHDDRVAHAVKRLAKQLKIENIKNSNLIEITYKSPDPQRSYGVLKSLGDLYVAKHVSVHRPAGSYEFFAKETDKYHEDLQAAEDKLRNFGLTNSVAAPDEQRSDLATQVGEAVGQQHATEQAIAADQERIKSDQQQMNSTPTRSTTLQASAINDKLIGDLNAALVASEAKRTQLVMKYDAHYPLVQEADQEIAQYKAAVARAETQRYVSETTDRDPTYELLREDKAKAQTDLSAQKATLVAAKRGIESMKKEMVALDQLSLRQQDLQRDAKADETNYLLYLGKREQERTSNALDVTRIANVAIAVPPAIPVLPVLSWPWLVVIALGAAFVLSIGAAYTVDYMDSSFHTPAQVIDMLGIPVVITVSKKSA
jgi:uncharacterized protein involved in exopolysaccharide biosynthesis